MLSKNEKYNIFWVLPVAPAHSGGPLVAKKISDIMDSSETFNSELLLSEDHHHKNYRSIDDILSLSRMELEHSIFIVTFGPLVSQHIKKIKKHTTSPIIYYAQSFGWKNFRSFFFSNKFSVPDEVDVVCVSRYVMGHWNSHLSKHRVSHIPPPISDAFEFKNQKRDIDILVHLRKQSNYCTNKLLPAIKNNGLNVIEIKEWVSPDELASLLNRTKVFLYHTSLFVQNYPRYPIAEGFGLPPLEALVCGAHLATDCLGGLNDYIENSNTLKLLGDDVDRDTARLYKFVKDFQVNHDHINHLRNRYCRKDLYIKQWETLIESWYPRNASYSKSK